jgi:predicted nucleotidyltransferase
MADDRKKTGSPDSKRINVNEPYELRDWSKRLGVSQEKLRETVQRVGTSAEAVKERLSKGRS